MMSMRQALSGATWLVAATLSAGLAGCGQGASDAGATPAADTTPDVSAAPASAQESAAARPNVILIVADDLGYGDLSAYGGPIATPHIDELAQTGARMTAGYVSAAVCSPSRAGLLTGRYQSRFGYEYNFFGNYESGQDAQLGLPLDQSTLADVLKGAGYATALVGKWHLGVRDVYHPMERGFDEFFGHLGGGTAYLESPVAGAQWWPEDAAPSPREGVAWAIRDGREVVEVPGYLTDVFAAKAVDFIERQAAVDAPFFLMLAPNAPHTPIQATAEYVERHLGIEQEGARLYAAMVSAVDDMVGDVMAALAEHALDNTLVFFMSDNGCINYMPDVICTNAPLSGAKRYHLEGGVRVPFIVNWQAALPGGQVYDEPVISLDVFATAAAAAGVDAATEDSVNLMPHLLGSAADAPHEFLFWRAAPNAAVRWGKWKLWKVDKGNLPESALGAARLLPFDPRGRNSPLGQLTVLYDLSQDIGEHENVATQHPEVVAHLEAALQSWRAELSEPIWDSHRSTLDTLHGERIQLYF